MTSGRSAEAPSEVDAALINKLFGIAVVAALIALVVYLYHADRSSFEPLFALGWGEALALVATAFVFIGSQASSCRPCAGPSASLSAWSRPSACWW